MSRHVPLSHEFDQKSFLELLSKAQGDRQQKEFAADIGMSKTYLNAFLTGKKNKPFTPQLLKKVSRAAHGRVTFEELLVASGYDPKPYLKDEIEDEYRWLENDPEFSMAPEYGQEDGRLLVVEKAMLGAITTTMAEKGYKFSGNPYPYAPRLNFKVELYDLPITEWGFILLKVRPSEMEREDAVKKEAYISCFSAYLHARHLLFSMRGPVNKISFVTNYQEVFEEMIKRPIPCLALYLSVILIDDKELTVLKEEYVETYFKDYSGIPTLV